MSTRCGALATDKRSSFVGYVAERAGVAPADVLAADLMTHDLTPSSVIGADASLLSAPRLDNLASCYAGMEALLAAKPRNFVPVLVLFDHEEVGSTSDHGAQSDLLSTVLERIVLGGRRQPGRLPAAAAGVAAGLGRHGTRHPPQLPGAPRARPSDRGQRRTGAQGAPQSALRHRWTYGGRLRAGLPAGRGRRCSATSTGPTCRAVRRSGRWPSARTGIPTVDVGAAQLAMHSARELMGAHDVAAYSAALQAFLRAPSRQA